VPKKIKRDVLNAIEDALASECIDTLAIFRHVIVHRGGKADGAYMRDRRGS
jgi:hypothetical protein